MSARIAELIYRFRLPLSAAILLGFLAMLPLTNVTAIDNDISMWISRDDPIYRTYERFREEFGGQRTLLIALRSPRLFTPEGLEFVRQATDDIARVDTVDRVHSLSTANIVASLPVRLKADTTSSSDDDGGIEVQPLLDDVIDQQAAARVRERVLADRLLRGDLVSEDGTVTAIVVTFDEGRIDEVRGDVIDRIHGLIDARLPDGMEAHYNGSLEISETYNKVTQSNLRNLTPPILLLTVGALFFMFRSWRLTLLVMGAVVVSFVWTMGLYVLMGFSYNVLASMLPPLVMILAIADDVHIVQHFTEELRATGSKEHAFKSSVRHLFAPLLGASATTALGLASLATSNVVAVRAFGVGAAVGVMVDFVMSLVLVPTLLTMLKPSAAMAPQERYFLGPMQRVAHFSMRHAKRVVLVTSVLMAVGLFGLRWLRVDTNHINFFAQDHPLHRSADLIDRELSGIYSFNILLEGEPESMKTPDALRRMEMLRLRLEQLPFVRKVVSVADYVKRVNRELTAVGPPEGGHYAADAGHYAADAEVLPTSGDVIAQELFVFGLSDEGRRELDRVVASDYSRAQISVKLASMSSDLVFEQINRAEAEAKAVFAGSGMTPTVTGSGRLFASLDHYIVVSQLSSFATAFLTVFAVIFLVFRSARFGALAIIANALPVCAVLGLMGWLGISLNVATVMVASVALGIVDDDTIHFIGRFRREVTAGLGTAAAIEAATMHEGRASLTTAIINSLGYGIMVVSAYKPTAWFGGLLALTMVVAFLAEVLVVPAVITLFPRLFGAPAVARLGSAA
ncbi:MAG: efflux RND transporter permease subunit [Vicinamibacterales bacterium]